MISNPSISQSASATQYYPVMSGGRLQGDIGTTEANSAVTHRTAGVLSNLYARISANDRDTSTIRVRKNGTTDGNQSLSVTGSTTGEFEDASNTDAVTAGDTWVYSVVTGSGGTTFILRMLTSIFAATAGTATRTGGCQHTGRTLSASSTTYWPFAGDVRLNNATEANTQVLVRSDGTLRNLVVICTTAPTNPATVRTRKSGANGNLSVSVNGTGTFEDATNIDVVASGDLCNFQIVTGASTQAVITLAAVDLVTTNGASILINANQTTNTIAASVTGYYAVAGGGTSTTETDQRADANFAFTASNLYINVPTNTVTATSTLRLRINGVDGNQAASITASTTGIFEDASNTDAVVATDEINYQIVAGATGTSLVTANIGMMAKVATAPRTRSLLGVGL